MEFFMTYLRNIKNAYENMFVLIFFMFILKRRQAIEEKDGEKTCDTLNVLKAIDKNSKKLIKQDLSVETNIKKIFNQQKSKTIDQSKKDQPFLHVNNNVTNENPKLKKAPDPNFEVIFNAIDDHLIKDNYEYGIIKNRMYNYHSVRTYWESISVIKKY